MADSVVSRPDRTAARRRSGAAWADLRDRLATVTPAALGRAALGVVVIAVTVGMAAATWPALLPFALGALLAYAVLPVVDALDRVMPRALAAAVSMLAVVVAVGAVFVIVVPPLVSNIVDLAAMFPGPDAIDDVVEDALAGLPPESQGIVGPVAVAIAAAVQDGLASASTGLRDIVPFVFQAALGVAGAILGLIVLPTWLLTLLTSKRRGHAAVDRHLAGWLRPDFWAVVGMADRAAGTYLRGFVVVAVLVGGLTRIGLEVAVQLGFPEFRGALALSVFAGAMQVIPELGPILGLLPVLFLAAVDPERAVAYAAVYLVARWIGSSLIGGRMLEDNLRVHRAILIPGVVVLGQVGPIALLLSAPILAFGTDLVRYLHGRLSEPARPAGILPGEPVPAPRAAAGPAPVPIAYRHSPPRSRPPTAPSTPPPATAGSPSVTR